MKNGKLVLGFDCDDILVPFVSPFIEFHNEVYGTNLKPEDVYAYEMSEVLKVPVEEVKKRIAAFASTDHFKGLKPYQGAVDGIARLAEYGHLMYVVSNRRNELKEHTQNFIRTYFPGRFSEVYLTNWAAMTGEKTTKSQAVANFGIDVFVEDCFEMAQEIAEAGKKVIVLNYPWNLKKIPKSDLQDRIFRADSWRGISDKIGKIGGQNQKSAF